MKLVSVLLLRLCCYNYVASWYIYYLLYYIFALTCICKWNTNTKLTFVIAVPWSEPFCSEAEAIDNNRMTINGYYEHAYTHTEISTHTDIPTHVRTHNTHSIEVLHL